MRFNLSVEKAHSQLLTLIRVRIQSFPLSKVHTHSSPYWLRFSFIERINASSDTVKKSATRQHRAENPFRLVMTPESKIATRKPRRRMPSRRESQFRCGFDGPKTGMRPRIMKSPRTSVFIKLSAQVRLRVIPTSAASFYSRTRGRASAIQALQEQCMRLGRDFRV